MFCGNDYGRFESEEHIIACALGNSRDSGLVEAEIVIPPGEVCDKCNGWRLSRVDGALVEWPPISVFRSLGQIRNRRRRLVDAVAGTRWHLELDADDPREFLLSATADTSRVSGRDDVARALCKIALETRWLQDPVDARSSRWDLVALAAIGGPLPESLAMGLTQPAGIDDIDFRPETILRVHPIAPWLVGQVSVAGLRLSLVIGSPPPAVPRTAWWTLDPAAGSLRGPNSMWARFRGSAASARRITSPLPAEPSSRTSRLPTHREHVDLSLQSPRSPTTRPHAS